MVYLLFVLAARWAWTSIIQQENVLSHRSDMVRHDVIQTKVIEVELYVNLSRIYHKKARFWIEPLKLWNMNPFGTLFPLFPCLILIIEKLARSCWTELVEVPGGARFQKNKGKNLTVIPEPRAHKMLEINIIYGTALTVHPHQPLLVRPFRLESILRSPSSSLVPMATFLAVSSWPSFKSSRKENES